MTDPKNLHSVVDRDETIPGALLMYANYASVDETHLAQDRMERWLDANWEWADRPAVAVKSVQQEVYFGIHVAGLPSEADEKDIEHFFSQFGQLHAFPKVRLLENKDGEAFVNFISLESANQSIQSSMDRTLIYDNSLLTANAGRNMPRPAPPSTATSLFKRKTQLCKYWNNGKCYQGSTCSFAHGENELASKYSPGSQDGVNTSAFNPAPVYLGQQQKLPEQETEYTYRADALPRSRQPDVQGVQPSAYMYNANAGLPGPYHPGQHQHESRLQGAEGFNMGGYSHGFGSGFSHMQPAASFGYDSGNFSKMPLRQNSIQPNFAGSQQLNAHSHHHLQRGASGDDDLETEKMMQMLLGDEGEDAEPNGSENMPYHAGNSANHTQLSLASTILDNPQNDFMLVQSWLQEVMAEDSGLIQVAAKFKEEAVDVEALAEFSDEELKNYGIFKVGWRKKLMKRAREEQRTRGSNISMPDCCICMKDGSANQAFVPCGHVCVCGDCVGSLSQDCPMCQTPIQSTLKLWFA
mmetsp:Transcript_38788/g.57001  ORF Transcript_38788/g.57001 Transcript_38788/m.57001 type:complete len:523 (+) Transcript_38788:411-1979(+)